MTGKSIEIIQKLKNGAKLVLIESFINPSSNFSFSKKITRGTWYKTYTLDDGSKIHHKTIKNVLKNIQLKQIEKSRTIAGYRCVFEPLFNNC